MVQENPPENQPPAKRGLPLPLPLIGALGGVVVIGLILVVVALGGGGGGDGGGEDDPEHAGLASTVVQPTIEATIDLARATVDSITNPTSVSEGDRMVISKFGVEAPLTLKTVGLDGVMPNPNGPDDVVIYDFSAWPGKGGAPGKGGNIIFSGHVDSGRVACKDGSVPPPCQAVFWDINGLRIDDEIEIQMSGESHKYRVTTNEPVNAATGPWDQIVSATAEESITLITCGGDFNRDTREYNSRQVVTAVRIV
ncbi:MAG: sortase [Dehalococcoidia bacterium]|nr:sortase [Dehalococcoidia bacterium]